MATPKWANQALTAAAKTGGGAAGLALVTTGAWAGGQVVQWSDPFKPYASGVCLGMMVIGAAGLTWLMVRGILTNK